MGIIGIICGYFIGGIPFAVIISKLKKIDIMKRGTTNPGAANVFREVGKKWGVIVWVLDTMKGIVAMIITAQLLTGTSFITQETPSINSFFIALTGVSAFCGHCWSPWLKFKGGKGVAISGGIFLYLIPKIFPIAVATYFLIQRKPREAWAIISGFAIVFGLIIGIYWRDRIWIIPFLIIFLIIAIIANISTIREMRAKKQR